MEIITMESAAYKDIVGRIEEIASHVRKHNPERREQGKPPGCSTAAR